MTKDELINRTKQFGLRTIRLVNAMPRSRAGDVIARQLLRSATSVGANYRAACRVKSRADFIAKLGIVEEEADECAYWLELIAESKLMPERRLRNLLREANELTAIIVASKKTARRRKQSGIANRRSKITGD